MLLKRKRFSFATKALIAAAIVVGLAVAGFCLTGAYVQYNSQIFPNVSIDGVDVSGLSGVEARQAVDVFAYDERAKNAEVTITFPNDTELTITGEEVRMTHDAEDLVNAAFSRGRGQGFIADAISFFHRAYTIHILGSAVDNYEVSYTLDMEFLLARVNVFTENYNIELNTSEPRIYDDRVEFIKGAGQVSACEFEVFTLAFDGLYKSLESGRSAASAYYLPESSPDRIELISIRDSLYAPPLCAWYDPETNAIADGVVGVDLDILDTIALLNATDSGRVVAVSLNHTLPETTREHLESILFRDLIGECITRIDGTAYRLNNIVLACDAVDGLVLEPGEEFSFNQTLGRRTYERGYRPAPAFVGGQTVQAVGGGICQVSSSIYSAIMDSDIRVTERYPHGRPVAYLPRGRDATVSWGTLDFRFENNTDYPLRIDAEVDGRTLTVRVFGTIDILDAAET